MIKIVTNSDSFPCVVCPIVDICSKCLDNNGNISAQGEFIIRNQVIYHSETREAANLASKCKQNYPNYKVIYEAPKPKHVLIGKGGKVITTTNSFWGMIGSVFLITIGACLLIALIGIIMSGIGSLFK